MIGQIIMTLGLALTFLNYCNSIVAGLRNYINIGSMSNANLNPTNLLYKEIVLTTAVIFNNAGCIRTSDG